MSPFWPAGQPIEVIPAGERPKEFRWRLQAHRILAVSDHWRVHTLWWAQEVWRDYWEVTTNTGLLCVLYRDLAAGTWRLERIYE